MRPSYPIILIHDGIKQEYLRVARVSSPEAPIVLVDGGTNKYTNASWVREEHIPYTKTLSKEKPDLVKNCILIINWWVVDDDNYDDPVDMHAVNTLSPRAILIFWNGGDGGYGQAGSNEIFNWLCGFADGEPTYRGYEQIGYLQIRSPLICPDGKIGSNESQALTIIVRDMDAVGNLSRRDLTSLANVCFGPTLPN
jgi:hypothetical protein